MLEPVHLGLTAATAEASVSSGAPMLEESATEAPTGEFPTLAGVEKQHILHALRRSKGNRTHAARMLDISIRTLRNKLNEYNFKGQPEKETADSTV